MSFLPVLVNILFTDIWTTIITLLIGFVVYKLSKFYLKVWSLPPGPIPLPFIGNILSFKCKDHSDTVFRRYNKKYGPVFTFWIGSKPFVFVTDIDLAREAFRKNDFAGKEASYLTSYFTNDKYQDVAFTDYGHTWEALRRVTHSAAQKYSNNERLLFIASNAVDRAVKAIISKEGINKEFNSVDYIYLIFLNILATSAYGINYSIEDEDFKKLKYVFRDFPREAGPRAILWEFSSLIRLLDWKMVKKHRVIMEDFINYNFNIFKNHLKDHDDSVERDFCDSLITAKNEALRAGKESAPYLVDKNLAASVMDLFVAGTDTSQMTFQWITLLLAYYPETQKKLRQEIETEIGDRIPTHEDRNRCHYVMAFISETLRVRNVVPTGLPHKAIVTSKIGDYTIPEGNGVFVYLGMILTDEKNFPNAQEFRPERFLENGKYMTSRPKAYIPFSVGRRACLGERLAIADLFIVLVRFLQSTADYNIELGSNQGIDPDPNVSDSYSPQEYKIIFRSK